MIHMSRYCQLRKQELPLASKCETAGEEKRRKIGEKSPLSSGRIQQGPSFRFLARPREDVIYDVVKVKKKARELVLSRFPGFPGAAN